jgi:hypothetical protein
MLSRQSDFRETREVTLTDVTATLTLYFMTDVRIMSLCTREFRADRRREERAALEKSVTPDLCG